ncbi:carboxypeptidase regulatory-like domain-containing protein [Paenibacillus sp. LjRoot153]|uniref:carboxypeptidase regulatory-like domain-containing protein n=1 Tax=Paenibacillus sp. LjRoot153 TaxID=3342270 RepID=UPI003ECEC62F
MSKKTSLRWLQLALAVILLFGSSLPAFAEVQEVNGLIAQVENDTGAPMQDGEVNLYVYMHYSSNGEQQYYTNQAFTTRVRNGEIFIPNSFILKGKQYELQVRGTSSSGEAIVYHYSFIGGDISSLNFGKDQLKRLTFTHGKEATGNLLLMPTDIYGKTDKVSYPMYTRPFNEQGEVTAWVASNAGFKAYASLVTQGYSETYMLEANIPADVQSGQSISFGGETVKVTPPTGYDNSGVSLGLQNIGSAFQARVGYVSKGMIGSVNFSVLKDNTRYIFSRGNISFTENITLQLDSTFQGKVSYVNSNGNGEYYTYAYYFDRYNNQLQFVDSLPAGAFSTSMQEKGLWNETLGTNGTPVRSSLNSAGTGIDPNGVVQALDWNDPILEYQLSQNGTLLRTLSGIRQISYPIQINNVSQGTYRLKLNRQLFPTNVVSLSLDQSIQIGQNNSTKSIGVQLPSGYSTSYLNRGAIIELDGSRVTASQTISGGSLEFYKEINPARQYRIVAAFLISSSTGSPTAGYLVDQTFTGEQMQNLQSLPLQSGLVRTVFSLDGTSITQMANVVLSLPITALNDQVSFSAPGVLLSTPTTLEASLVGTDGSTNAYHYNKSVTIPAQEQNIVSFAELANSLISVELKNGQTNVPFEMVSVLKSNYSYSSILPSTSKTEENKLTKLYTTPGEYRFQFSQVKKADYETPWRYIWSSERRVYSEATSLSFNDDIQGVFGPIQTYDYTNPDRTLLYTSAIIKAGDLNLNQVFVKQGNSYQTFSTAIVGKGPYDDGGYSYYNSVPGTLTVKDESGNVVIKSDSSYSDSVYAEIPDKNGNYLLTYQLPIGPGQEIAFSQPYSVGDPNAPPGKPDPKATFAGQGLKLTWDAVSGASYYDVYAAEQGQTLVKIKGNVTGTSFTYAEAQPGKIYDLKVVAVNSKGISTESSIIHFAVPAFAVSQLDVKTSTVQSSAGLLKMGSQMPIELTGSIGDGISAKAVVSFKKGTGTEVLTEEVVLTPSQGKYLGTFEIKEGVTEIVSVKAYLTRDGTNSDEKKVELNKKVGATLAGTIKQRDAAVTDKPDIEFIIGGQYVKVNADANGNFTAAGLPGGSVKINVIGTGTDRYTDVVQGITTELGVKQTGIIVKLPVLQNVKLRLLEQGTQVPVTRSLHVSISGSVNKEGYIGQDGYFATYSGESELRRLKPGSYTISIIGDSLYEETKTTFNVDEVSNYVTNPVTISVAKKIKGIANVTLKLFMPEGAQTNQLESYYLYSSTASQSFGWESGYLYGYNQSMTVSERVYVPNPLLVLEGADPTVTQKVYGYYGTLSLPGIAAANDYTLNVSVPGLQPVNKSQVTVVTGTSTLEVALQPSVVYTGRIVDEAGRPVVGADVSAYAGSSYAYARTDADGSYRLDRLSESNQIQISVHAVGFTDNTAMQQVTDHQIPLITLENDQFIHGKVVDKDNKPLKYVSVYASNSKNSGWARTDADGYFKIRGLSAGTYKFSASLYGYPSYENNLVTSADQRTIVLQSQGGHFFGEGNSFAPSVATVILGKEFSYSLKYKNNNTSTSVSTIWSFELPSNVKLVNGSVELNGKIVNATATNGVLQVPAGDVIAGGSGEISFKALVDQADEASIRTSAYPVINGNKEEPTQIATSNVLYVTLNAPAVTGDKKIKVYGSTKPGSTVEIFAGSMSLGRVTAEGRWWYADVVLPVAADADEAELRLTAQVVENNQSQSSEAVNVKYKSGVPGIDEARITAGWNVDVKLNPKVSVATFAVTEKTPISTKVVFKEAVNEASISFIGSTYPLTKSSDGKTFTGEVPYGWSSYGEQMLTLTYVKNGLSVTVPLMEVIVLIDPSGYVFEGSMDNRVSGVTAVVQQENNTQWTSWNADDYGQINPQTTDVEGRYGWDVLQGNWRVLFSKEGYEDYTSRIVVVPPAETQLNVPLVRTTTPEITSITPANNAQDVNVSSNVDIVFDRPMDETSLNTDVIQLVKVEGVQETPIDVTFEYQHMKGYKEDLSLRDAQLLDGNNQSGWFIEDDSKKLSKKLTLKPRTALASGSTYKVIVKGNLLDYSGSNILVADTSYTFKTVTSAKPMQTGGGGGNSVASNELELDFVTLSKSVTNNEVHVTLTDKQDTILVKGNVWNAIQSKGYIVKLQHKDAEVTIPAKAFVLKDDETLELVLQPSKSTYPVGYTASSQTLQVSLGKKNNGKKEELTAAEPLILRLSATPSNEPELLGAYEFVNGTPHYLGREINVSFSASGTFGLAKFERKFMDVDNHWAKQDIQYLVSHHIVDGTTDTEFDPAGTTTRGQIAKLFAQMLQLKNSDTASSFVDVSANAWYADAVAAVEKAGIFQGADGQFRPDAAISRQELAVVISRLVKQADLTVNKTFADQDQIADWAKAGVNLAVKIGIIQGDDAGKFLPQANATRAEAAAMIRRLIQALDKD